MDAIFVYNMLFLNNRFIYFDMYSRDLDHCFILQKIRNEQQKPTGFRNQIWFRFSDKFVWFSSKLWALHVQNTNNIANIM